MSGKFMMNGIEYLGGGGAMDHHYSTDEVIVGTWIDGKPLYERTYHTTAGSVNTYNQFDFGLFTSTISMIRLATGYVEKGIVVSNVSGYQVPSSDEQICGYIDKVANGNVKFDYRLGSSIAGGDLYLTIQYTKITD